MEFQPYLVLLEIDMNEPTIQSTIQSVVYKVILNSIPTQNDYLFSYNNKFAEGGTYLIYAIYGFI